MGEPLAIVDTVAEAAAVIHLTIPRAAIQEHMEPAILEVLAQLAAQGLEPAGPLFTHHLSLSAERFDFEVGFPIRGTVRAVGRVKPGTLPAARVARAYHSGAYEGLSAAWVAFGERITAAGHAMADDLWERYLVGPETTSDPYAWRTELNRVLLP